MKFQLCNTALFLFLTMAFGTITASPFEEGRTGAFEEESLNNIVITSSIAAGPTDINLSDTVITENNTIIHYIGKFTTSDADISDTHLYTLISGIGDDDNASFSIQNDSLMANAVFDYESDSLYSIRIQTDDQNGGLFEKQFNILIRDTVELDSGLIAYYPFNGNANDESGNGNNGIVNGATLMTDRNGNSTGAYFFDGVNDNIEVPFASMLDVVGGDFAISTWLKVDEYITNNAFFITQGNATDGFYTSLTGLASSSGAGRMGFGALSYSGFSTDYDNLAQFGQWHQLIYMYFHDDNTLKLYIDGKLVGTGEEMIDPALTSLTTSWYFGNLGASSSFYFKGFLDDIRLYNRVLSNEEIAVLAENRTPTDIILSDTLAFEQGSSNQLIGTLSSTDLNCDDVFTYSLVSGVGDADNASFTIQNDSLLSNTVFDYETDSVYSIRVRTTDSGGALYEEQFTIKIIDVTELDSGLLAYYPFNGNANDASGNDHHGVINGVALTTDKEGRTDSAYFFNGSSDIEITAMNAFDGLSAYTISAWTYATDLGDPLLLITDETAHKTIFSKATPEKDFQLHVRSDSSYVNGFTDNSSSLYTVASNPIGDTEKWAHVLSTWDGTTMSLYVNGVLVVTTNITAGDPLFTGSDVFIGSYLGDRSYFTGTLDELRIYNRVLTFSEIEELAEVPTISLSTTEVKENNSLGQFIAKIENASSGFLYSLVAGEGDDDNGSFMISNDSLFANVVFDYETKQDYSVRIQSDNQIGGLYGKSLLLTITDAVETASGLLAYYPFNGNANDESGNGNHGTVNGTTLTTDKDGVSNAAYFFDGSDDIAIANHAAFNNLSAFTLSAWVYPTAANSFNSIVSKVDGGRDFQLTLLNNWPSSGTPLVAYLRFDPASGGFRRTSSDDRIPLNTWTHVLGQWDGTNWSVAVNGKIGSKVIIPQEPSWTGAVMAIGSMAGGEKFTGKIDEVRIYNRAVTVEEIAALSNLSPTDIVLSDTTIAENNSSGAFIGKLSSVDADDVEFLYSLVSGSGDDDNASFSIQNDSLMAIDVFDYESDSLYSIRIQTDDQNGGLFERQFTILVQDEMDLGNGLVAYYPFDGDANDYSGNNNHGTVNGAISGNDRNGVGGKAYSFDGVNDYIQVTHASILNPSDTTTVSLWFLSNSWGKSILSKYTSNSERWFMNIGPSGIHGKIGLISLASSIDYLVSNNVDLGLNEWNHVAFVYNKNDETKNKVYLNGVEDPTIIDIFSNPTFDNSGDLFFGQKGDLSGYLDGYLDEVRLYHRALSLEEIKELALSLPYDIIADNLVIEENNSSNQFITKLTTSDASKFDEHLYSMASGIGAEDNASFMIRNDSLFANAVFNYEEDSIYRIRIRTDDQNNGTFEKQFTIFVDDLVEFDDGLLAYYPFNGNAQDESGNNNHGIVNGAIFVADSLNNTNSAMYFDGINDNVEIADHLSLDFSGGDFSFSLWLNLDSYGFGSVSSILSNRNNTPSGYAITLTGQLDASPGRYSILTSNGGDNNTFNGEQAVDRWTHVAYVYDFSEDSILLYIDSEVVQKVKRDFVLSEMNMGGELYLGYDLFDDGSYFKGSMDEVRIYDKALSHEEVQALAMIFKAELLLSDSTIAENDINGFVGRLFTQDASPIENYTYTLVPGVGDDDNALFEVREDSLFALNTFDYEFKQQYTIRVKSDDLNGTETERNFAISVLDEIELEDGLLAYYPFNGNANDESGNGNNGTVNGAALTTDKDGNIDQAYNFDGTDDISISDQPYLNGLDSFSVSVWMRVTTFPSQASVISKTDPNRDFVIQVNSLSEGIVQFYFQNGGVAYSSGSYDMNENEWIHVVGQWDGNFAKQYVNGILVSQADLSGQSPPWTGTDIRIGSLNGSEKFIGDIDEVRIYGRLMSHDEIQQLSGRNVAPTDIRLSNAEIIEDNLNGQYIGKFTSIDADFSDTHLYSLVTGLGDDDNASFSIRNDSLLADETFDFDVKSNYKIRIQTNDQSGGVFEKTFFITVLSDNLAPTRLSLSTSEITENNSIGDSIGLFTATDPNIGDTFTYSLVSGTGDADNGSFEIEGDTLRGTAVFDFETKTSYTIRVRVSDDRGAVFDSALVVTILSDNLAPTALSLSTSGITESNAIGDSIGLFTATDPNIGDTFTYSLVSGTGDADNGSFEIEGDTLRGTAVFDFETKSSYTIRVRVSDDRGAVFDSALVVTILSDNLAPTALSLSTSEITENNAIGDSIGLFTATDPNIDDTFTYSLVSGTGDADNDSFEIEGDTLRGTAVFDFEMKTSYTIRVRVSDDRGALFDSALVVTILSDNLAPTALSLSTSGITENNAIGDSIGLFTATDPNVGDTFTYSLVSGTGDADNDSFEIEGDTLRSTVVFDFETKTSYTIRVRVSDDRGAVFDSALVVTILSDNLAPTSLSLSTSEITENNAIGDSIGLFTATDPNVGDTFTYSLVSGTGDVDNGSFEIEGDTLRGTVVFDFETKTSYTIRVRVSDDRGAVFDSALVVTIQSDNLPPTDLQIISEELFENNSIGQKAGTFEVEDPDVDDKFTFELISGTGDTDNNLFTIVDDMLLVNAVLDYDTKSAYSILVQVRDNLNNTFVKTLSIEIENLNEAPTGITLSDTSFTDEVDQNVLIGFLSAEDQDAEDRFTYALTQGEGADQNSFFAIFNENELRSDGGKNFIRANYYIRIIVIDSSGETFERPFVITRTNVDFNLLSFSILENNADEQVVASIVHKDSNSKSTYSLDMAVADNADFIMDGVSLKAAKSFNYEEKDSLIVVITENKIGGEQEIVEFTIRVRDVNDPPGSLMLSDTSISENNMDNLLVGTISAIDEDHAEELTFSLVPGEGDADNSLFRIVDDQLYTDKIFDYEERAAYSVRVQVKDKQGVVQEKAFSITIDDIDEREIEMELSNKKVTASHHLDNGIAHVLFSSSQQYNGLSYQIIDDQQSIFKIENNTLILSDNSALADETQVVIGVYEGSDSLYSKTYKIVKDNSSFDDGLTFGHDVKDYRFVSFPIATQRVADFMTGMNMDAMGNGGDWRLITRLSSGYIDLNAANIVEPGKGYWFISRDKTAMKINNSSIVSLNADHEFAINILPGWNLIGNPFLDDLSWSAIRSYNESKGNSLMDRLSVDAQEYKSGYKITDDIKVFRAILVKSTSDITETLYIPSPVIGTTGNNARKEAYQESFFDKFDHWKLGFRLEQGNYIYDIAGLGFHHKAIVGEDIFDHMTPPAFSNFNFSMTLHDSPAISMEIVPYEQASRKWFYNIDAVPENATSVTWDRSVANLVEASLMLELYPQQEIIDMKRQDKVSFIVDPDQKLVVHYGEKPSKSENLIKTTLYPVPTNDILHLLVHSKYSFSDIQGEIQVFDRFGREIQKYQLTIKPEIVLKVKELSDGLYFCRIKIGSYYIETKKFILKR